MKQKKSRMRSTMMEMLVIEGEEEVRRRRRRRSGGLSVLVVDKRTYAGRKRGELPSPT